MGYREFNRRDRVEQPQVRRGSQLTVTEWEEAIIAAADVIRGKRVVVLASPNLSNESLFLLERLVSRNGGAGVFRVTRGTEAPLPGVPDLSLRAERAANGTGARRLGYTEISSLSSTLKDGDVLIVADDMLAGVDASELARASTVVHIGTTLPDAIASRAAVVLPIANTAEEEGTFTNLRGRVQRFMQAKAAPGVARPSWYVLADLLAAVGGDGSFYLPAEVFAAMSSTHRAFAGLSYDALGMRGLPILEHGSVSAATVGAAT